MNMFGKILNKSKKVEEEIYSPLTGEVVSLEEVPDPVFAQRMMGDGVAIIPDEGVLVSPVEGKIIQIFHTKHAIGIKSVSGLEILIHIGLETVELNGEGFDVLINEGQSVKAGDPLVNFDIAFLKSKGKNIVTPLIITNSSEIVASTIEIDKKSITRGDSLIICPIK